jgi:hypothetical protein
MMDCGGDDDDRSRHDIYKDRPTKDGAGTSGCVV